MSSPFQKGRYYKYQRNGRPKGVFLVTTDVIKDHGVLYHGYEIVIKGSLSIIGAKIGTTGRFADYSEMWEFSVLDTEYEKLLIVKAELEELLE